MKEIVEQEFEESIKSNTYVIIEFRSDWCVPCKTMHKILEEIMFTHENISVFEVDADEEINLCETFNVRNLPTTLYYNDGELVFKSSGTKTKEDILNIFN